jgi:hypothetical protein
MTLTFPVNAKRLEALTEHIAKNNGPSVEQFLIDSVVNPYIDKTVEEKESARRAKLAAAFAKLTVAEQTAVMKLAKAE